MARHTIVHLATGKTYGKSYSERYNAEIALGKFRAALPYTSDRQYTQACGEYAVVDLDNMDPKQFERDIAVSQLIIAPTTPRPADYLTA